jgi:uncharacterized membrane protein YebE (DUF533 family)
MDKTQIILFSAAMAFLAVRLYQKYIKKNKNLSGTEKTPPSGTSFPSSVKDDEYEPYSKK